MVVVAPAAAHTAFREAMDLAGLPGAIRLVAGGATRQESVANGLGALPRAVAIVAIQDGARPCTPAGLLAACAASAREHGSGVAAHRVTDTIKIVSADGRVSCTPDRETLMASETPQVFRRELLARGLKFVQEHGIRVTDDAQAVEVSGADVCLVLHAFDNPKVTYPGDLAKLGLPG